MIYRFPTYYGFPYTSWVASSNKYWEADKIISWKCVCGFWREKERGVTNDDFFLIFGFEPLHAGVFEQNSVDLRLGEWAKDFSDACINEEKRRRATGFAMDRLQNKVSKATARVAMSKKKFWTAHQVAEANGYQVRPRIDYPT